MAELPEAALPWFVMLLADHFNAVDDVVEGRCGNDFVLLVPFALSLVDGHGVAAKVHAFSVVGAGKHMHAAI